jgi:hypothetical protein
MTTMTITFDANASAAGGPQATGGRASLNLPVDSRRAMPLEIPEGQLYYWSAPWQGAEQRALADVRAGRTEIFDDPAAAVRHLFHVD